MIISEFALQTWILTKKDLLLIARRRWFSTFIRAVAFPIVLTVVLASVKSWIHNNGGYGIGPALAIRSLPEAFDAVGDSRKKFVIVDRNLPGADVRNVISQLSTIARNGNRDLRVVSSDADIKDTCPSSSKGVTSCFAAVDFWSSPDQGPGAIWNYTMHFDGALGAGNVNNHDTGVRLYTLPLQRTIDSLITGKVPDTILQYSYTQQTQAEADFEDSQFFGLLVTQAIAFALFIGLCGIAYHLTGHVVRQREEGMLQLIDAQMPNKSRYESLAARTLATHLAFDLLYMPAWIVCGAVVGILIYPHSNAGWYVLLYFLAGLAMTSFSILASSLFRRQQLSAISAIVAAIAFAIVAQFSQSGQKSTSEPAAIATGLLFPPSAFVYFLVCGAVQEIFSLPLQASSQLPLALGQALGVKLWDLTPATLVGFFIFQIVLYPVLAIIVERSMWGSSFRGRHLRSAEEMGGNAVRLSNFQKRYNVAAKKRDRTLAVDSLSLDLYAGSITVLLGANGSGKSTTLSCIAGLESITHGEIDIDGSGGIGLCPQKNVMWPDMTVEEHVWFFQQLKNPSMSRAQSRQEVARLIDGCDLKHKTHARSKTLSGGQKRKLQLSMMLAGGSKVCCIDEASSGIDPLARRKIWDILLRERGHRTLLLTTHFLDESEVLADHIAILSKGKLRAEGTVAALKSSLGGGFSIILPDCDAATLGSVALGDNVYPRQVENNAVLDVPDSKTLAILLSKLDSQKSSSNYRIESPSVEKIFLRLAEEMKLEQENNTATRSDNNRSSFAPTAMALHTGRGCSPLRQTGVLFRKRLTILKHNFMPYVASLFVPLVVAGLVTRFLLNVESDGLQCSDPNLGYDYYSIPMAITPSSVASNLILGPASAVTTEDLIRLLPNGTFCYPGADPMYCGSGYVPDYAAGWGDSTYATSLQDFNDKVKNELSGNDYVYFPGGFFLTPNAPPEFAYSAENGIFSAIELLATLDMAVTNTSIAVSYDTFATGYAPKDFFQSLVAVFTTLGFALFPGLFALYVTRERLQKVRAMQYSNGITSGPLWSAYALFDAMFLLLISILVTVIWLTNGYNWYGLGYLFVVFLLYGMASTAYSYVISLFATSQLAAVAMTTVVQVVISMLFFVGCFLILDMSDLTVIYSNLSAIYYTIALICPAVSLLRALMVTLNVYSLACQGQQYASYPGAIELFGGPILYLTVQFFLLVAFLIFWESGRSLEAFGIRIGSRRQRDVEKGSDSGSDAAEDSHRLSAANQGLRVQHISKTFGSNLAVDDVSFGVLPSEKFALLGPNGAGKSTMISLIRDEIRPDQSAPRSEIHISGDSLMAHPVASKAHLGVCPQFDAVDSMTLKENLAFYARARGLTSKQKDENIHEIISRLGLTDHANKLVKKLSGGTKRKLSLGIALIGNPSVLLLDEPSSGMDAAAKRALWETLASISADRCLLITTHSMEEADALCDRAGIMASQMLALGSISDLHERFADKLYIQIVHQDAPRSSLKDMDALWTWVKSTFHIAELEKSVVGQVRFAVPIHYDGVGSNDHHLLDGRSMGRLFNGIESSKEAMGIRDYSISHATLDQVFLNVVSRHGVDEENSAATEKRGLVQRIVRR